MLVRLGAQVQEVLRRPYRLTFAPPLEHSGCSEDLDRSELHHIVVWANGGPDGTECHDPPWAEAG